MSAQGTDSATSVPLGRETSCGRAFRSFSRTSHISLLEHFCHCVLLSGVTVQTHEREELVLLAVFGLAIGE